MPGSSPLKKEDLLPDHANQDSIQGQKMKPSKYNPYRFKRLQKCKGLKLKNCGWMISEEIGTTPQNALVVRFAAAQVLGMTANIDMRDELLSRLLPMSGAKTHLQAQRRIKTVWSRRDLRSRTCL